MDSKTSISDISFNEEEKSHCHKECVEGDNSRIVLANYLEGKEGIPDVCIKLKRGELISREKGLPLKVPGHYLNEKLGITEVNGTLISRREGVSGSRLFLLSEYGEIKIDMRFGKKHSAEEIFLPGNQWNDILREVREKEVDKFDKDKASIKSRFHLWKQGEIKNDLDSEPEDIDRIIKELEVIFYDKTIYRDVYSKILKPTSGLPITIHVDLWEAREINALGFFKESREPMRSFSRYYSLSGKEKIEKLVRFLASYDEYLCDGSDISEDNMKQWSEVEHLRISVFQSRYNPLDELEFCIYFSRN